MLNLSDMPSHAGQRLGLLTSSQAKVIMHGSMKAWRSLSKKMWTETEADFSRKLTAATEYGHQHEAEGAAKFWERHHWVRDMYENQFFMASMDGSTPFGSSPDRVLATVNGELPIKYGLEIKSPTSEDTFESHNLKAHWDQCQHGLLVTGFRAWFLFVHLGDKVAEWEWIEPDLGWQLEYLKRAAAFWRFHNSGERP